MRSTEADFLPIGTLARFGSVARLEHAGLTPLKWLGAPPEVMDETLRFIDRKYGSVQDYLIHCGFDEDKMNRLRDAMAVR